MPSQSCKKRSQRGEQFRKKSAKPVSNTEYWFVDHRQRVKLHFQEGVLELLVHNDKNNNCHADPTK